MTPHPGKVEFEYLGKDCLYVVDMERRMLVFNKLKLRTSDWVPTECRPLIKYCSGYYSHPDITWKKLKKNQQITLLASKLRAPNNPKVSTWEKIINNICKEVRIFIEQDPTISPGTVKEMVNFVSSLFKLINYEISFIDAKLSSTAERTISILVFACAFKSVWKAKRFEPLENKAYTDAKKVEILRYFLQKIENRKMVRGTWDHQRMKESDHEISCNIVKTKITYVPYDDSTKSLTSIQYYICFVIDGTGSMITEINKARVSVGQFVGKYKEYITELQFKVVIYRDHCDDIIIEKFPSEKLFTPQYRSVQQYFDAVKAYGGGDYPEAVLDGLATAASECEWKTYLGVRNIIIHIFDAPPHGDFPNYESHDAKSIQEHCCCCNHGTLCQFDWNRDVWDNMKKFNIQYHGINTGKQFPEFEATMQEKLGSLCGRFQSVGKEEVDEAILQIFINHQMK